MNSTSRPLAHIGLAKSASTFLQQAVFPKIAEIEYLGKNTPDDDLRKAGMMIVRETSNTFRPEKAYPPFQLAVERAGQNNRRAVYSEEDLSVFKFLDPETMSLRLHQAIGNYDVLMICRDPYHWVQSNYQFRLSTFNPRTLWGINYWLREHMRTVGIGSDISEIHYTKVLDTYGRHCGGLVNVIPYELLSRDQSTFAAALSEVVGAGAQIINSEVTRPRDPKKHKGRITQMESDFIRESRKILLGEYRQFIRSLESYLSQPGARPNGAAILELERLAAAQNEDFMSWVGPLRDLRVSMSPCFDKLSKPAEEVIAEEFLVAIDRVGRIQKRLLRENYKVDLEKFGIRYHGEA